MVVTAVGVPVGGGLDRCFNEFRISGDSFGVCL